MTFILLHFQRYFANFEWLLIPASSMSVARKRPWILVPFLLENVSVNVNLHVDFTGISRIIIHFF